MWDARAVVGRWAPGHIPLLHHNRSFPLNSIICTAFLAGPHRGSRTLSAMRSFKYRCAFWLGAVIDRAFGTTKIPIRFKPCCSAIGGTIIRTRDRRFPASVRWLAGHNRQHSPHVPSGSSASLSRGRGTIGTGGKHRARSAIHASWPLARAGSVECCR